MPARVILAAVVAWLGLAWLTPHAPRPLRLHRAPIRGQRASCAPRLQPELREPRRPRRAHRLRRPRVRGEQRTDSSTCVARRNAESNSDSDSDADQEKTGFLRHLYIK